MLTKQGAHFAPMRKGWLVALVVGVLAAGGAALAGVRDRSDERPIRVLSATTTTEPVPTTTTAPTTSTSTTTRTPKTVVPPTTRTRPTTRQAVTQPAGRPPMSVARRVAVPTTRRATTTTLSEEEQEELEEQEDRRR